VIPSGFAGVEQQLLLWMLAMIRPAAAFIAAPMFSAPQVPVQLRVILALAIGIPAAAISGITVPADGIVSFDGLMLIIPEIIAGVAMGFAVQIGYSAALLGGEAISNSMGLGFAAMTNPMGGPPSPAISQFLSVIAIFLFLGLDGHLLLIRAIVNSYIALPPGEFWLSSSAIGGLVQFGGLAFSAGLAIALPVGAAMVMVQLVMAMIARSTPTLNLFAVGLPATLLGGLVLLAMAVPIMADLVANALSAGLDRSALIADGG
jgi:flagellar biosynthesis protein FliR